MGELIVWILDRVLLPLYAMVGSICGLLVVLGSSRLTIAAMEESDGSRNWPGLDQVVHTARPTDTVIDFANWAGWRGLEIGAEHIDAWMAAPARVDDIATTAALVLTVAAMTFVALYTIDVIGWKPMTAAWIATAALAQSEDRIWPGILLFTSTLLVITLVSAMIAERTDSEGLYGFRRFVATSLMEWAYALITGPVAVFRGGLL